MAEVQPFAAIRYDFDRYGGDLSNVVAPPYDVLDESDKADLLSNDPHNVVAIDLPHLPPKDEGPPQAYQAARSRLDAWLAEGVLVREERPAVYVYHQSFDLDGRRYTRRQFIARVRLREFTEGVVLPHEQIFGGPKADRLALMKATRCNLSSVLAMYTDADQAVASALDSCTSGTPDATATLEDVVNDLWVVTEPSVIDRIRSLMADKRVYIADGHHRYGTALEYRKHIASHQGGNLPDEHPANWVMLVLASMDDPGCVILGYARLLSGEGVSADSLLAAWAEGAQRCSHGGEDLVLYDGRSKTRTALRFTNRAALDRLAADHSSSWRKLDVAYLHRYLIDELATGAFGKPPQVGYDKSVEGACAKAEQMGAVAVLPKATPMAHLRAVSEDGELMPQKSTFFFPKVATGLTINPLYD